MDMAAAESSPEKSHSAPFFLEVLSAEDALKTWPPIGDGEVSRDASSVATAASKPKKEVRSWSVTVRESSGMRKSVRAAAAAAAATATAAASMKREYIDDGSEIESETGGSRSVRRRYGGWMMSSERSNQQGRSYYCTQSCNNCGKVGHLQHQCKMPIISTGVILCRRVGIEYEYLMICRKDSLGFVDFMRGKYSIYNKNYILNMMRQMTRIEKERLRTWTFDALWEQLWHPERLDTTGTSHLRSSVVEKEKKFPGKPKKDLSMHIYRRGEDYLTRDRFEALVAGVEEMGYHGRRYDLISLLEESEQEQEDGTGGEFEEPEWGFPKGRKNHKEKDLQCALREFEEETGYDTREIQLVENLSPFEEIFTGSNYKSYKHKYFLALLRDSDDAVVESGNSVQQQQQQQDRTRRDMAGTRKRRREMDETGDDERSEISGNVAKGFQTSEVSRMAWFRFEDCMLRIRPYNLEKKRVLQNIHMLLSQSRVFL